VEDKISTYELLLKRSPFFRIVPERKAERIEPIVVEEEPQGPLLFKYKGRAAIGAKVVVVIEDQGTGKSYFVESGSMIGDFLVSSIGDEEVVLQKKGGEEIILSVAKKEQKQESDEEDSEL